MESQSFIGEIALVSVCGPPDSGVSAEELRGRRRYWGRCPPLVPPLHRRSLREAAPGVPLSVPLALCARRL